MNRTERVIQGMEQHGFTKLLVSDTESIDYLSGFHFSPGNRMLILELDVTRNHQLWINELFPVRDFPYPVRYFKDTEDPVGLMAEELGEGVIGIDKNWPSRFLLQLLEKKPSLPVKNGSFLIDLVRQVKDEEECGRMREASRLNDQLMERTLREIRQGLRESEIRDRMKEWVQEIGADEFSFSPIIAFGHHSADPHHETDDTMITGDGAVVLDIGCKKNGYCADMTRSVYLGEPPEEYRKIYAVVREANERAIAQIRPGVSYREIDAAARDYITEMGYGEQFTHRLGHNIGREVHEFGDVSAINEELLKPGMIFSVEPGIYLEGKYGVRIEDLVLVTEEGVEVLNHVSKDLRTIG